MREMFKTLREDKALTDRIESTFPDVAELAGEIEVMGWFERWNWELKQDDVWPPAPPETAGYLAAGFAVWDELAARPDLTAHETTSTRWELAILRYLEIVAHVL